MESTLLRFSCIHFEALHNYLKHIEDVLFFAHKNIIFDKITAISTLTFQTLNVLRVMGEDGARGKDWLRARGHHLCLTDTIF